MIKINELKKVVKFETTIKAIRYDGIEIPLQDYSSDHFDRTKFEQRLISIMNAFKDDIKELKYLVKMSGMEISEGTVKWES